MALPSVLMSTSTLCLRAIGSTSRRWRGRSCADRWRPARGSRRPAKSQKLADDRGHALGLLATATGTRRGFRLDVSAAVAS